MSQTHLASVDVGNNLAQVFFLTAMLAFFAAELRWFRSATSVVGDEATVNIWRSSD